MNGRQIDFRETREGRMKILPRVLLGLLILAGTGFRPCFAELNEVQVKSAYVFNFIKFVEWPANSVRPGDKLKLCVIGDEPLYTSLTALEGRQIGEYELHVARILPGDSLNTCHVLFIGEFNQRRLVPIIKSLGNAPVLTVSDIPGFAERGGAIGLLRRNGMMLFEVNLAATRKAGLRLSSQMLNLAANVFGK
jgi:hypothetical protein